MINTSSSILNETSALIQIYHPLEKDLRTYGGRAMNRRGSSMQGFKVRTRTRMPKENPVP